MYRYLIGGSLLFVAALGESHSVDQKIGRYHDKDQLTRTNTSVGLNMDFDHYSESLTSSLYGLTLSQGLTSSPIEAGSDLGEEGDLYDSLANTVTINGVQTWNKLTETRQSFSLTEEGDDRSRSAGIGVSQWFHHETLQVSLDLGRQILKKPPFEMVDTDAETVRVPGTLDSTSARLGLRHLATKSTIMDYGVGATQTVNRPLARTYSVGIKQFVPPLNAAIHGEGIRYINKGKLDLDTTYGELEGGEATVAWLQKMWSKAKGRLAYRYYREDEKTRAFGDELTMGSDTVSLGLSQGITLDEKRSQARNFEVNAKASRYKTNSDIDAEIYEVGIGADF
jgi:hypothetical protein